MLQLNTLGSLDLRADGAEVRAVLQQPKRLALFIYLVRGAAAGKFVRRDSLLAMFWPELDQEHARAALRRAIYFLRRALGDGVIEGRGDEELRVPTGLVECDATLFEAAIAAGNTDEARRLCAGDFLPGFFVAGASEAEEWIDAERSRLRALAQRLPPPQPSRVAPASAGTDAVIAILPFDVSAGDALGYLGEGMVDLLHAALGGVRGWRLVDPRLLLSRLEQAKSEDPKSSAERLAATHLLRGSVSQTQGKVRVTLSFEPLGGGAPTRIETVGDSESALFDMVDDLVRRLISAQPAGQASGMARVAARTTTSLSALKSWLTGEHDFRLGRYREAAAAFEEATRADTAFPLAQYRLAASRAALADIRGARAASAAAMRDRDRLALDAMNLVEAQHCWLEARPDEAERRYLGAVAMHPDDVESWYLLGDLRVHANPYRGRSIREAREPLERALALDSSHLGALAKLARLDALEDQTESLARNVERYLEISPDADQALAMRALRAWKFGRMTEKISLMASLRHARPLSVAIAFGDVALYTGATNELETMGRAMITAVRSKELRALCHVMLAHVMLARGRHEAARAELEVAAEDERAWTIGVQGLLAAMPFWAWDAAFVDRAREQLASFDPASAPAHSSEPLDQHNGLHGHIRSYVLGLLAAKAGDAAALITATEELAELDVPEGTGALVERMERTLSALARRMKGDEAGALALVEGAKRDVWYQLAVGSPVFAGAYDRYLRAELLIANGREEEAQGWLSAIGERTPWELPFIEPAKTLAARPAR